LVNVLILDQTLHLAILLYLDLPLIISADTMVQYC
jgi:hypothetical protein